MPQELGQQGAAYGMPRSAGDARYGRVRDFSLAGTLTVGAGVLRLPILAACRCSLVRAAVATAPTGAAVIVDVNKNGTTIFTTQGNRPTIAAASTMSAAATPDAAASTFAAGDYITVDVDQVGSTVAGANLVVALELQPV